MKRALALYGFLILLSAVPGHSLDLLQDIGFRGAALSSRQAPFEQKLQSGSFLELQNILCGESFAALFSLGYHSVQPSNLAGGWGYRGFEGFHLWLGAEWYFPGAAQNLPRPEPSSKKTIPPRFGLSAALGGFYSMYRYTDLLFFYTALRVNLFADLFFSYPFHLRIGLPTEIYFRRDLDSSFSTGIGLWIGVSWARLVGANES